MTLPDTDRESLAEIESLMRSAVDCALASDDFAIALSRFHAALADAAPTLMASMVDDAARRGIAFAMLREVWKVAPRPDHHWRPLPLPKIERNSPCPCGSGRKFKQCCGEVGDPPPFGDRLSVLGYVLDRLPVAEYARLPFKLLSPEELAHVASEWLKEDRHETAIALLEPLLADPGRLDARHEHAFDVLCEAYMDLDLRAEREALVAAMEKSPDRELRSAALHRRCTMLADDGDYDAAWLLFREAQRTDPDNPSLAHLELVLLGSQGETEQLAARARFWSARLRRLGYEGERIVEIVDDIARDPQGFVQAMAAHDMEAPDAEALHQLADLADALPEPAAHYRLQAHDGSAGPLMPEAPLAALEADWRGRIAFGETDIWADAAWVEWLAEQPLAWQSFAVLDDIALALDEYPFEDNEEAGLLDDIEEAVLDHAVALLRRVIAHNGSEGLKLEWGWTENRAALSLLSRRIDMLAGSGEELSLLEWMVLTLNPDDNLGYREHLAHTYAHAGRPGEALAVCDRYPDDAMGAMLYARVLALALLDRRDEAATALAQAKQRSPRILKTLLAAHPKPPRDMRPGVVTLGGEDEAWRYRTRWGAVWGRTGALAWLRQTAGAKG